MSAYSIVRAQVVDTFVHCAVYEFDDDAGVRAVPSSDALEQLAAEFDRKWGDNVVRNGDIVDTVQAIAD